MRLFIILFLFLLLFLFIPIKFKSKVIYNILNNKGYLSIYFYFIKLFDTTWEIVPFKIIINNKNKKDIKISLYDAGKEADFKELFFKSLLKKVKLINFRTIGRFGIMQDCLLSSAGSGALIVFLQIFNCFLMSKKRCRNLSCQIFTDFNKNNFLLCITTSIKFNLFVVITCALSSLIKKGYREKYYGK